MNNEKIIEAMAFEIFKVHDPGEDRIPVETRWRTWPESPRDASLAQETFSRREYREFATASLRIEHGRVLAIIDEEIDNARSADDDMGVLALGEVRRRIVGQ